MPPNTRFGHDGEVGVRMLVQRRRLGELVLRARNRSFDQPVRAHHAVVAHRLIVAAVFRQLAEASRVFGEQRVVALRAVVAFRGIAERGEIDAMRRRRLIRHLAGVRHDAPLAIDFTERSSGKSGGAVNVRDWCC